MNRTIIVGTFEVSQIRSGSSVHHTYELLPFPYLAFQPRQCAHPDYVSLWKRYQKVKRQKAQLLTKQSFKVKLYLFPLTIVYRNLTHTESEEVCSVRICRVLSWNSRTNETLFSMEFETGFSKI